MVESNPETGLEVTDEDKIFIESELHWLAQVRYVIDYEEVSQISQGNEGSIYKVRKDNQYFALKRRMNPGRNPNVRKEHRKLEYLGYL